MCVGRVCVSLFIVAGRVITWTIPENVTKWSNDVRRRSQNKALKNKEKKRSINLTLKEQ